MTIDRRWLTIVTAAAAILGAAALFALFAPARVGGDVTYALISGTSMEPTMGPNDLVLVRPPRIDVPGDVVAYHSPDLGLVIHRVTAIEDGRLILQGDNNDWTDSHRPALSEVAGKLWVSVPGAGRVVRWLAPPLGPSVLGVLALGMMLTPGGATKGRGKRRDTGMASPGSRLRLPEAGSSDLWSAYSPAGSILLGCAVLAGVVGLALAAFAFARPASRTVTTQTAYTQSGDFRYHAPVRGNVHDSSEVANGAPVFLSLADEVTVDFDYTLTADGGAAMQDVAGTHRLVARISQLNGWERTIELASLARFEGDRASVSGVIDLGAIRGMIDDLEDETGVHYETYLLDVTADVAAHGMLGGLPIDETFAPVLPFKIDGDQLQLDRRNETLEALLSEQQTAAVSHQTSVTSRLGLLGISAAVAQARLAAIVLAALGGALGWLIARRTAEVNAMDDISRIRAKYGAHLVDSQVEDEPRLPRIVVSRFEDLLELFEGERPRVFVQEQFSAMRYFVIRPESIYEYRAGNGRPTLFTVYQPVRRANPLAFGADEAATDAESHVA